MMLLEAQGLHWSAGGRTIVQGVGVRLHEGECVGLIGPNGCGKSSLLRMLYRAVLPERGQVQWRGRDIWQLSARDYAREVAVLGQEFSQVFDLLVHEVVMMGRIPHQSSWARDSEHDLALVRESLEQVGCWHLQEQAFSTLSGGEKQRVLLARALAQQPRALVLDEPTNHLDIRYQLELMALIRRSGRAALVAIHDLNIAAQYCDRLYLMQQGRLVAEGTPAQVLTAEHIAAVYGVQALVDTHPVTRRPRISFWTDSDD